jgi:hypothetical protein
MSYIKYPFNGRMNADVTKELEPIAFWAVRTTSLRMVFTFKDIAPVIVEAKGIEPCDLGREVLGRLSPFT